MTKEELFNKLDFEEGDSVFIVRIREGREGYNQQRICHRFHPYFLIGLTDVIRDEIFKTIQGEIKPSIVETERVVIR